MKRFEVMYMIYADSQQVYSAYVIARNKSEAARRFQRQYPSVVITRID